MTEVFVSQSGLRTGGVRMCLMSIKSIKKLIKEGDIPQARSQLRESLSKTPEDTVAQMLYGTCCQLMGDSEFGQPDGYPN